MYVVRIDDEMRRNSLVRAHADQIIPRAHSDQVSNENQHLPFDLLLSTFDIQPQLEVKYEEPEIQQPASPKANNIHHIPVTSHNPQTAASSTANNVPQITEITHNSQATRTSVRERRAPTYLRNYELF